MPSLSADLDRQRFYALALFEHYYDGVTGLKYVRPDFLKGIIACLERELS
jgi:hypothetical protein